MLLKKLLFSVNCQTTVAHRAIRSFHSHHLWVHHTVNYIIPPHMWVHHTVRNMGPPHSGGSASFITVSPSLTKLLESCQQWKLTFLSTVAFRATKNLEDSMFPVNYRSWQRSFSELPILSTVYLFIHFILTVF